MSFFQGDYIVVCLDINRGISLALPLLQDRKNHMSAVVF